MTMTAGKLYEILRDMDIETYEWPLTVAFRWKGETVISDILSVKINGKTIQLNEGDFVRHVKVLHQLGYDMGDDVKVIE